MKQYVRYDCQTGRGGPKSCIAARWGEHLHAVGFESLLLPDKL